MIFGNLGKAEREILHIGTDSRDLIGPIESKSESENGDDVFSDVRFRCKSAVHRARRAFRGVHFSIFACFFRSSEDSSQDIRIIIPIYLLADSIGISAALKIRCFKYR